MAKIDKLLSREALLTGSWREAAVWQMSFVVCLRCGRYVPTCWDGRFAWQQRHGEHCTEGLFTSQSGYFFVCAHPETLSTDVWEPVCDLSETELLGLMLQGDE